MANASYITYVGHATVLIELDGQCILTDPVLRDQVTFLRRRGLPVDPAVFQDVDAVLISHLHYDHLDFPSLRLLGHDRRLIVPRGAARLFHRHGFRWVEEIRVGEVTTVGELAVRATYADHSESRHPFGLRTQALGFLIAGSYEIYFPGDTDLFPEMADLSHNLDVALLPVWGWGPTIGPGHMDPLQAAKTLHLLRPRLAIPIHWGSLHPWGLDRLNPGRFLTDPPHTFARHAAHLAPEVRTHIIAPGQAVSLEAVLDGKGRFL
jgi:L-ascorbate metabolism protein UlaG (beta-lactamase superfamily)